MGSSLDGAWSVSSSRRIGIHTTWHRCQLVMGTGWD
jgi:hypothetical protein